MGLYIGAVGRTISALPQSGFTRLARPDPPNVPRDRLVDEPGQIVRGAEDPSIQAGFGENSLSPLSAAQLALETNLNVGERLVPTFDEIAIRARLDEATASGAIEPQVRRSPEILPFQTSRPEPSATVQNFATEAGGAVFQNAPLEEGAALRPPASRDALLPPDGSNFDIFI